MPVIDATDPTIALELERLRGTFSTNFAEIKGQLDVIRQQGDQAQRDIAALSSRIDRQETRLSMVERRLVFVFGASSSLGAAAGIAATFLGR